MPINTYFQHLAKFAGKLRDRFFWLRASTLYFFTGKVPPPWQVFVEVNNQCNLKCPHCVTGLRLERVDPGKMEISTFKKILSEIPSVRRMILYGDGEPLFNPELINMIKLAVSQKVEVVVSSHFGMKLSPTFFETLVQSKLHQLIIPIDGLTQETYEKYRVGGNLAQVMENIHCINEAKKRLKSKYPKLICRTVVSKYNENELPAIQRLAQSLGMRFTALPMTLHLSPAHPPSIETLREKKKNWLGENKAYWYEAYLKEDTITVDEPCKQLFSQVTIGTTGKIYPCCDTPGFIEPFGNLEKQSFKTVWNSPTYQSARSLFSGSLAPQEKSRSFCEGCRFYTQGCSVAEFVFS